MTIQKMTRKKICLKSKKKKQFQNQNFETGILRSDETPDED